MKNGEKEFNSPIGRKKAKEEDTKTAFAENRIDIHAATLEEQKKRNNFMSTQQEFTLFILTIKRWILS